MTGKTHQIVGIASGLTYFLIESKPQYSPSTFAVVSVGTHIMALLPDIDSAGSEIWNSIPFGKTVSRAVTPFFEHRNFTHSILGAICVGYLLKYLLFIFPDYWGINKEAVYIPLIISYFSHIVSDMFTVEGVPLFFPYQQMYGIPPKPFEGIRIETGKWFENLIIFPLVNIYLIWLVYYFWPVIKQLIFY